MTLITNIPQKSSPSGKSIYLSLAIIFTACLCIASHTASVGTTPEEALTDLRNAEAQISEQLIVVFGEQHEEVIAFRSAMAQKTSLKTTYSSVFKAMSALTRELWGKNNYLLRNFSTSSDQTLAGRPVTALIERLETVETVIRFDSTHAPSDVGF